MKLSKAILLVFISFFLIQCNPDSSENLENGPLFTFLNSEKTGVEFTNYVVDNQLRNYTNFNPIYDGGGVAAGDINNDGLPDLYFTGNEVPNKLFLNKGNFEFEDITK